MSAFSTVDEQTKKEMVQKVLKNGPNRVMVNQHEARPPKAAREQHHLEPDVVFVRWDGWSLGAPFFLQAAAFDLWSDEWVAYVVLRPTTEPRITYF